MDPEFRRLVDAAAKVAATGRWDAVNERIQNLAASSGPNKSETELHSKLNLPGSGCAVRSLLLGCRLTEGARVGGEVSGLTELHAIEQVVALCSELQVDPFGEVQGLLQEHVPVVHSRTVKAVAPQGCPRCPNPD